MIVGALLLSGLMIFATFDFSKSYSRLVETSDSHIQLRKDARELMDASDYLTERVQHFANSGDINYLDEYFAEALESKRREEAISKLSAATGNSDAVKKLEDALYYSMKLMNREYRAMKLILEAQGLTTDHTEVNNVTLTAYELAMSPEEKMQRAMSIVTDSEYFNYERLHRGARKNGGFH